ncbi:MAG: alpha/beta hydrolase [Rhizobiaceae bacterium]
MTNLSHLSLTPGSPVVALHCSASNHGQWNKLAESLESRHEFFAFDLPGYGSASQIAVAQAGMAAIAGHIIDQIEKIEEPVHLIGHSYGGAVALKVALMRPDLINSLNLFEPAAFHLLKNDSAADGDYLAQLEAVESAVQRGTNEEAPDNGMAAFIDFWNGDGCWKQLPENHQQKIAMAGSTVMADFGNIFGESWGGEDLSRLPFATQVLMGMESPMSAQRTAVLVFQSIKDAELVMLPGVGHMAPINAADWVNPRICQHIARAERSAETFSWPRKVAA